jgi:hypothetical protein
VDIQSEGVITISNIVNALVEYSDIDMNGDMSFSVFNERFKDECGGVLADVAFTTTSPMGICNQLNY